jgi:hypothetical protein
MSSTPEASQTTMFELLTSEGIKFSVARQTACLLPVIRQRVESDPTLSQFFLEEVNAWSLHQILKYVNRHADGFPSLIQPRIRSVEMATLCADARDAHWIDQVGENIENLHALTIAAKHVGLATLQNLTATKQAALIKKQTMSQKALSDLFTCQTTI